MARRRFRYNKELGKFVELVGEDEANARVAILGEIEPFISPRDGTLIRSRSHLRDYMGQHNLVHFDDTRGATAEGDRYESARKERALREMLWEGVSKTFSMGSKPRRQ